MTEAATATTTFGLMMDDPLLCSAPIRHAARWHGDEAVVARADDGSIERSCWADVYRRSCRLGDALARGYGLKKGGTVATLAFNGLRHLELYHAVPAMGAVLHTVNPRLHGDQIVSILNRGGATLLFVDGAGWPTVEPLLDRLDTVRAVVGTHDRASRPTAARERVSYEALVDDGSEDDRWPVLDERSAATLCFTSGTTGEPKGVLYSHRSILLACMRSLMGDQLGPVAYFGDVLLAVPPMFHANGWNLPWIAPMAGVKLVLPGRSFDAASLAELIDAEGVTATAAVPTVWSGLMDHWQRRGHGPATLRRVNIGGAAPSADLLKVIEQDYGIEVFQGWGMTETSALGNSARIKARHRAEPWDRQLGYKSKQGRIGFGVHARIVADDGGVLPHDGRAAGELQVRGPWIAKGYLGGQSATTADGWLRTGDVARIDPDGYLELVDRLKDVIKSGGEWIGSLELERIARTFPGVADAAVIGIAHPRWNERPLLVVVAAGAPPDRDALLAHIASRVAKWWVPDDVVFIAELPMTGTGKIDKVALRARLRGRPAVTAR